MADDKQDQDKSKDDKDQKDDQKVDVKALQDQIAALQKEKDDWTKGNQSLNDKVKLDQDQKRQKDADNKSLESALTFNITSSAFLSMNESLLPKEIGEIFKAAEKETYGSAIEKANATKAAIVQSFFSQQANVEYLTESQKLVLADYLKLTKTGKEEKAKEIYDNLFEPALGTLKRVKKAEEITRAKLGYRSSSQGDSQYKEKLMAGAKKHFLGEK